MTDIEKADKIAEINALLKMFGTDMIVEPRGGIWYGLYILYPTGNSDQFYRDKHPTFQSANLDHVIETAKRIIKSEVMYD